MWRRCCYCSQGELSDLSELPAELSLRAPGSTSSLSERERNARSLVRALERAWRDAFEQRQAGSEDKEPDPVALQARSIEAIEARIEELRAQPGFDEATAAAYLAFRRLEGGASTNEIEALLGRAENRRTALHVFHASLGRHDTLTTFMSGDVDEFARHVCARGCSTLELRGTFNRR